MYSDNVLQNVTRNLKAGLNVSMQAVLNATIAGVLYFKSIALPDTASTVRIYSNAALRAGESEQPLAISTAAFVIGAIINASEWATFAIDPGVSRTLQLICTSTATVSIELF
jgi:hypothetical protein